MWRFLEAMLTGEVTDPVFLLLGAAGTLVVFVTLGGILGSVVGIWRGPGPIAVSRGPRLGPFVAGAVMAAVLMGVGILMSWPELTPLAGISSWLVSVVGGVAAGIGWWVGYSGVTDRAPSVRQENPFADGEENPFGEGKGLEDFLEDDSKNA